MVMHWTVNPAGLPTTGSIPVISTTFEVLSNIGLGRYQRSKNGDESTSERIVLRLTTCA